MQNQNISAYPWKTRGACYMAPKPQQVDKFCEFIDKVLAPDGINCLLLIVRYDFEFQSHPEVRGDNPLSISDVKKILSVCRKNNIELIPKMNLLGHQGIADHAGKPDGLARSHPEFLEIPLEEKQNVHFVLCPSHPDLFAFLCDLMDEMIDAFEAKAFHFGCDEVFSVGICDRCKDKDPGDLFASWVNKIAAYIKAKGVTPMMWADRLLNSEKSGYGTWEASNNGTWKSLGKVDKDIILFDWHYENWPSFPSIEWLTEAGYKIYMCTFSSPENAKKFFDCGLSHNSENILGTFHTTWTQFETFIDRFENSPQINEDGENVDWTGRVIRCYHWLYRSDDFEKLPNPVTQKNL